MKNFDFSDSISYNYVSGGKIMEFNYNKLWNMLLEKKKKKTQFAKVINISNTTLAKFSKKQPVSILILGKICETFECNIEDVVKIEYDKKNKTSV